MFHTRKRVSPFAPRLEALEDRSLLSCTVSISGSVLKIEGDGGANSVRITDNGTGAAGNIVVKCDGTTTNVGPAITEIRVNTKGGNDSVRYDLSNDLLANQSMKLKV